MMAAEKSRRLTPGTNPGRNPRPLQEATYG